MEIIQQEHQKEFDSEPVYDEKYLKAKMKSCKGKINKNVYNDKIPKKRSQCICLSVTLNDSAFRTDNNCYN